MNKQVIVGISIVLIGSSALGGYIVGSAKGDTVMQYQLTKDVTAGQPLDGAYQEVPVSSKDTISRDHLILDESLLKGSVAYVNMYKNQAITEGTIGEKVDKARNFDFAMPITVEGSVANTLKVNDMVAIKVKYKDNRDDAVVVPYIPVTDIRTSNGAKVDSTSAVPAYLLFEVSDEENIDLNNASKEGTLFVVRYHDLNQDKLTKTYKKGQTPGVQSGTSSTSLYSTVTATSTASSTAN